MKSNMKLAIAAFATLFFCTYLALFPAFAAWLARRLPCTRGVRLLLVFPAAWVLTEWVRGWMFTGFPWLALGYSHPIAFQLPAGVTAKVDKQVVVTLEGADRELLGQVAAALRELRPPEPYKGKGMKYAEERIHRKAGKTAGAGAK